MILVKEKELKQGVKINGFKNGFKKEIKRIYINTLMPKFQYENSNGKVVIPNKICINL